MRGAGVLEIPVCESRENRHQVMDQSAMHI